MNVGIVQITSAGQKRHELLTAEIVPACIELSRGCYSLVSPSNPDLMELVTGLGGTFVEYDAWERDMSRKWRQGLSTRMESWIGLFADDILPDDEWMARTEAFLKECPPGQYGFRLTDRNDRRHPNGEDWMQAADARSGARHRPLWYDEVTGAIEQSPTAYVANCVVHREVVNQVQPFGVFGMYPDVLWSMALRSYGYPIGFNPTARAYHLGDRSENRDERTDHYYPTIGRLLSQLPEEEFVDLAYQVILSRHSDAQGRSHWIERLNNGMTRRELVLAFTRTEEFERLDDNLPK